MGLWIDKPARAPAGIENAVEGYTNKGVLGTAIDPAGVVVNGCGSSTLDGKSAEMIGEVLCQYRGIAGPVAPDMVGVVVAVYGNDIASRINADRMGAVVVVNGGSRTLGMNAVGSQNP